MNTENLPGNNMLTKSKTTILKIFTGKNYKRNIVVISLFLLALGFVYYKHFATTASTTYEYATTSKKDLQKTVEGSGKVVSVSELDIQQLQSGGKVTSVLVRPGDYVKTGQVIATLDNRQASIQLAQAKASYDKVINGSTKEDLDITKQGLLNSQASYEVTKKAQDLAVSNAKKNLFNNGLVARSLYDDKIYSGSPTISGSYTCDSEVEYKISINSSSYASITGGDAVGSVYVTSVPQALGSCGLYISFDSTKTWNMGEWVISIPNKLSTSYSSNLNAYNTALQSREQALLNASTSVVNAQLSLNQKTVGARAEDIASAKASLASAQLSYENTIIRAPFDGQIGSVSAAVGQQTNSQQGVATIITKDKIAEVSLNEIDIVNVKLGQDVDLKFDAIPEETFKGKVSQIDTIGVNTSNVVSFAVKISIPNADERIKSGMSVTANIITDSRLGVLTVPSATIKTETVGGEEKSYVMKKVGGQRAARPEDSSTNTEQTRTKQTGVNTQNQKVYVTTGLSNDIDTEILEGLVEGDQVVSKTVSSSASTKTTTSTFSLFGSGPRAGGSSSGTRTTTTR